MKKYFSTNTLILTAYRKKLLDCYYIMLVSQILLARSAFQLYMHFEMDEMESDAEEEYEVSREMLDNIKHPVVERINQFIKESDVFIDELEDRNFISEDDLEDNEEPGEIENGDAAVRVNNYAGMVIFYLRLYVNNRIEKAIKELSEIQNEIPIMNPDYAEFYKDDNIKSILLFKAGLSELLDYLEKETDSIAEKRNW